MRRIMTLLAAALLTLPTMVFGQTWVLDTDHTNIGFKVRHLMVTNVKGDFRAFSGTVNLDDADITRSNINVSINTASINTGVAKRDEHLRSADFFDTGKYPTMTFASKKIVKNGNAIQLIGDLTIRGITRSITLDVQELTGISKDPWGNFRRGATAVGKISRSDYGLTWNKALETGGVAVGDEVAIILDIEMIRK